MKLGWNDDDDEPDLVVKQSSKCDGDGESGSDTLVAEDHGGVGGGRGVGGGPEDTRQALQQRGEQDTGPGPGHRPPELTGVMAPAGDHHTEAWQGEQADGAEEEGGEAGGGHVQPAEAQLRAHEVRLEYKDQGEGVEEAGGEAAHEDADRGTGDQERWEELVLVPGDGGGEDDERLQEEEAEGGRVEGEQGGHGHQAAHWVVWDRLRILIQIKFRFASLNIGHTTLRHSSASDSIIPVGFSFEIARRGGIWLPRRHTWNQNWAKLSL